MLELVIGDKPWSSWSMRPWLVLKRTGAPFTETAVRLRRGAETAAEIARHSPSGQVPVLKDGPLVIWDSLAICERLAELFPEARLWPEDAGARALARTAAAEMHAGFPALRREHAMDLTLSTVRPPSEAVAAELRRLVTLWRGLRRDHGAGGDFLFGDWTIADAFFTPVATRLRTYDLGLRPHGDEDGAAQAYADALLAAPEYRAWEAGALSPSSD